MAEQKGRGGLRSPATLYAGKWRLGKTRLIRVPEVLADELLVVARRIDAGELAIGLLAELAPGTTLPRETEETD